MKGPGLRNDLEIRRTWKCPLCGRISKQLGNIVALTCSCTNSPIQMQLQPEIRKAPPKFEKVVIPLTEEDLIVRERPRRIPEPVENGAETDRRPVRPKRPKPERRSFESFQEELGTAEPRLAEGGTSTGHIVVEGSEGTSSGQITTPPTATPHVDEDDSFGAGLT